jgi:hypothetical protein
MTSIATGSPLIANRLRKSRHRNTLVPVAPLIVIGVMASGFVVWVALTSGQYSDFVVWYDAARAFREGRDLYFSDVSRPGFRNMNPPQQVVLMAPLAWLSIRDAVIAWWLVTLAAMYGCVRLWAKALPSGWPAALFGLMLASAAGYLNIRAANQSWVIAWAVTLGWILWRGQQVERAAALLGAAASIKLFLLLLLPYFIWRRRWTAVAFFVGGMVAASLLGLVFAGPRAFSSWYLALTQQTWQGQALSMSLLGGITRALDIGYSFQPLIVRPSAIFPLWAVMSAALILSVAWHLREEENADRDFAAVLILMLLIAPAGWMYYLPLAGGPLAATLARSRTPSSWLWIAGSSALLFPYPLLGLGQPSAWSTVTLGSFYMWGGLLLLAAIVRDAHRPDSGVTADTRA